MEKWKKDTALFLGSQSISLFGSSIVQYAILWYITLETKSGIMMTISIICGFVPAFFLSPLAGVWADRYSRKKLIILSDGLIAFTTLILAIIFLSGHGSIWLLFITSAIRSLGTAVQTPAIGAILPQFVPFDKLTRVNGINSMIQSSVMLVSPMVSGALLTFASLEAVFFIDVLTATIAISILGIFFKVPLHQKALGNQETGYLEDFKLGLRYIRNHGFLLRLFVFLSIFFLMMAPVAFLTPLQVARSFGEDVWRLTAIEIAFSIGMMGGGIIIAAWGGFSNRVYTMTLGCFLFGFSVIALGLVPNFWIYIAFMLFSGVMVPIFNTPCIVLIQEKVEENYLGRVFGIISMLTSSMMPLGMLIFGPLADVIKIEWMLVFTGFIIFLLAFLLINSKTLVREGQAIPHGSGP